MRQFARFKERHPECVLLFRIGDFYETFDDDAVTISKALGLTLTQRTEGVPMAGVPYHQLETYLRRLVALGFRVAVCDQVQDPREVRGGAIVERAVTRVITPGTLVDEGLLDAGSVNKLAAVVPREPGTGAGRSTNRGPAPADPSSRGATSRVEVSVAVVEASTGAFTILDCALASLGDELVSRGVQELLHAEDPGPDLAAALSSLPVSRTPRPGWHFRRAEAAEALKRQFQAATLAGFGLAEDDPAIPAAGAIVRYLQETQAPAGDDPGGPGTPNRGTSKRPIISARRPTLAHLLPPRREDPAGVLVLDGVSLRALEVERTIRGSGPGEPGVGVEGSLLGVFAGCRTPMGRRLIREWLCRPLSRLDEIERRHRAVALLVEDRRTSGALSAALDGVQDVARIAGRIALGRATPRDLVALGASLGRIDRIGTVIEGSPALADRLAAIREVHADLEPVAHEIAARCVESPPPHLREGGLFRDGVDPELDEARLLERDASSWLSAYQARLIEQHQLPSLRVGFNSVFGYYIELPAAQARRAPAEFTRKQTLTKAERYTTPELKEFEQKVTTARDRALDRERVLFDDLCARAAGVIPSISAFARVVGELDVLLTFADHAVCRGWTRPEMTADATLRITGGRHPVLESVLGDRFVPNDVELGGEPGASLALITGPNMAGKSTFIRQTALIVLLAHAGSFVPAERAVIGLADRLFTRVGADDALHAGQSTFLVEMVETANILNNATGRSVVILDEIGRGTSTLDGLSLAWAIAERLALGAAPETPPRTLFATHYHELTELEERLPGRVRNLHVSVREWGDQIVFLHRIMPGRTDRSYGIHVARLAGVPADVLARAREVLESLAVHHGPAAARERTRAVASPANGQMTLFTEYVPHPAVDELREIKLETLTPMQAFDALRRLHELSRAPGP